MDSNTETEITTLGALLANAKDMTWWDGLEAAGWFAVGFGAAYAVAHRISDALGGGAATLAAHMKGLFKTAPAQRQT